MMDAGHPMDETSRLPTILLVRISRAYREGIVWKDMFSLAKVLSICCFPCLFKMQLITWMKPVHFVFFLRYYKFGVSSHLCNFPLSSRAIQIYT